MRRRSMRKLVERFLSKKVSRHSWNLRLSKHRRSWSRWRNRAWCLWVRLQMPVRANRRKVSQIKVMMKKKSTSTSWAPKYRKRLKMSIEYLEKMILYLRPSQLLRYWWISNHDSWLLQKQFSTFANKPKKRLNPHPMLISLKTLRLKERENTEMSK